MTRQQLFELHGRASWGLAALKRVYPYLGHSFNLRAVLKLLEQTVKPWKKP